MFNDALSEMDIDSATRDAHGAGCIECNAEGCQGCPAGSACELPRLVEHEREWMCPGCRPAFDAHVSNAVPVEIVDDLEETTPIQHLTNNEIAALDPLGIFTKEAA